MRTRFGVLMLAFALCANAAALFEHVPLQWRPTSELKLGVMQMSAASIQFATFQDARDNKESIGENLEDKTAKPVTTKDDVGAFVGQHMRELFNKAGLKTVDSDGTVTIKGELKQFFVRETNTYDAQVTVHLSILGKDGATLWSGLATGDANRFGRSYKLENYYEVLSDCLVNAVSSMLQNEQFQKALSGG